ncbi:anti-sigma B factor RsbW [Brevibacillus reuszeri]|uniref:anti-sigma B factor RsbW n=1 Tax=Brevibacillus reuszeri TaxID=54915 RepID=UPI0028A04170|nr:anti-sigma B factor RsbW [Brevibacillus reuszeri]
MNPFVSITIPAEAEYLDIVRLTLYSFATKAGFSFEEIEDMKVAVSEACNNAILHAYGDAEAGMIDLRLENDGEQLTISVQDYGQSFVNTGESGSSVSGKGEEISELSVGGLGIFLMEALMDEVHVHSKNGKGTRIVLSKRLSRNEERV